MSKKQTSVIVDRDNTELNKIPYFVSVAGTVDLTVKAVKTFNPSNGAKTVSLTVPTVVDGLTEKPKLADATLDAIARRIEPNAKVYARSGLEFGRYQRLYKV